MHRFMRSVSLWTLALVALGSIHQANSTHSANNITYFTPERRHAVYVTEDAAGQLPLLPPEQDPIIRARNLAQVLYGLDDQDMVVKSNYTSVDTGITHVYLRQRWDDYEIINADMNINLDPQGLIVSYGSSFVPKQVDQPVAKDATLDQNPVRAVHAVVEALGYNSVSPTTMATEAQGDKTYYVTNVPGSVESATPVRKVYLINEESQLVPVWQVTLRTKDNWVVGHAVRQSASAAESASNDPKEQATLVSLISWRSDAVYNVYGLGEFDPLVGRRRFYKDPANQRSSPLGWHNNHRDQPFTTTQGNNVIAQQASTGEDWRFKERPNGGRDLVFNFPLNLSLEPRAYTDAAVVNTFYWVNILHDIFYLYGFDEKAGNFQQNNLHRGGLDNDPVIAYVQDHSDTDTAYFVTPPDGQPGEIHLFEFTKTLPQRDSDLDASLLIHEFGHGVSTRLTGGPANSDCLGGVEPKGLGEGWSDFFSVLFRLQHGDNRNREYTIARYVENSPAGIRRYPYSTSTLINPLLYSSLNGLDFLNPHNIGMVWATILNEVMWNMIDAAGLEPNLYDTNCRKGNVLMFKYVMAGLKHQPCGPDFIKARDAILQAERWITGGQYQCALWNGFAKRGLGEDARKRLVFHVDGFRVPQHCQGM